MDERIDLSMSDPDLVPLIIQVYNVGYLGVVLLYLLNGKFLLPLTLLISRTCRFPHESV